MEHRLYSVLQHESELLSPHIKLAEAVQTLDVQMALMVSADISDIIF